MTKEAFFDAIDRGEACLCSTLKDRFFVLHQLHHAGYPIDDEDTVLSSPTGMNDVFMAVGFADLDDGGREIVGWRPEYVTTFPFSSVDWEDDASPDEPADADFCADLLSLFSAAG